MTVETNIEPKIGRELFENTSPTGPAQTKSSKRALRRHHAQRKFVSAYRKFAHWKMEDGPELQKWLRRNYNHLAMCSCYMCGHRRKWEGITVQERRSLLTVKDEI